MQGAGIRVETSKGEAWPGQQEINFRYADALTMADNHVVYKNGAKEIAFLNGCSITFMAKPDHTWIGSSCHIHSSLWRERRERVRRRDGDLPAVPRRPDRVRARARALLRAERQLVQAVRGRLVGADDARVGARQPHVRVPDRRLRRGDARRVADPRRRRQSVPRVRGDDRGGPPRHREQPRAAAGARRERVRVGRGAVSVDAARGDRGARVTARSRGRRSATTSSTTTSTTRAPSRRCSTRSSRRGSGSGSTSVGKPVVGITTYLTRAALGRVGSRRRARAGRLRARGRARRRACRCSSRRARRSTRRSTRSTG